MFWVWLDRGLWIWFLPQGGTGVPEVGIMAAPTMLFELRWTLSQVGSCLKWGPLGCLIKPPLEKVGREPAG